LGPPRFDGRKKRGRRCAGRVEKQQKREGGKKRIFKSINIKKQVVTVKTRPEPKTGTKQKQEPLNRIKTRKKGD